MTNPFLPTQPAPTTPAPAGNPFGTVSTGPVTTTAQPPALDLSRLGAAAAPIVGGTGAKLKDMFGRLVLVFPLGIARVARNPKFITPEQRQRGDLEQERMTATVVVLDDGQGGQNPIQWGGDPYALPPTPHTNSDPLPYVRKGMWINQSRLIGQLRDSLPTAPGGAPGMIAGRVAKTGPAQNDPWYLIGATETEVTLVRRYLEAVQAGHAPHPLA